MLENVRRYVAGEIPLKRVFFYDMLLIGTIINITIGLATLLAFSLNSPIWLPIAIYLSAQPYNVTLCISVWRSAGREASRWSDLARIGTIIWFPVMLVI